jgi:hypothetical protein
MLMSCTNEEKKKHNCMSGWFAAASDKSLCGIPIWLTVRNVVGAAAGVSAVKLCEVLEALMVAHI